MKQALLVKLAPEPEDHAALLRTQEAFNVACNAIADVAYAQRQANKIELQKLVYYDTRQRLLWYAETSPKRFVSTSYSIADKQESPPYAAPIISSKVMYGEGVFVGRCLAAPQAYATDVEVPSCCDPSGQTL